MYAELMLLLLMLQMLGNNHHLVAIDLPGHGASSTPPAEQELTIEYALESIKLVCQSKEFEISTMRTALAIADTLYMRCVCGSGC